MIRIFQTLLLLTVLLTAAVASLAQEPPKVSFCQMVRTPGQYFDKPIRIIATLQMGYEGMYLRDEQCPLTHDLQIGAHPAPADETQRVALNKALRKISTTEFGGRAVIGVIGILRNASRRDFVSYKYRLDIVTLETMNPVIVPYKDELQAAITYRALVRADDNTGLALVPAVRMPLHYALLIEWTNLKDFPELKRLHRSETEQIVFVVTFDELKQMTVNRWNRTTRCKILSVR